MLWAHIFIVICALSTCSTEGTPEDPLFERIYSQVSTCFKGPSSLSSNVTMSVLTFNRYHGECLRGLEIEKTEKNPFCYKACMLGRLGIIGAGLALNADETEMKIPLWFYFVDALISADNLVLLYLGLLEHDDDLKYTEEIVDTSEEAEMVRDGIKDRFSECVKFGITHRGVNGCRSLSSADREKVNKLINCVDDAMVC